MSEPFQRAPFVKELQLQVEQGKCADDELNGCRINHPDHGRRRWRTHTCNTSRCISSPHSCTSPRAIVGRRIRCLEVSGVWATVVGWPWRNSVVDLVLEWQAYACLIWSGADNAKSACTCSGPSKASSCGRCKCHQARCSSSACRGCPHTGCHSGCPGCKCHHGCRRSAACLAPGQRHHSQPACVCKISSSSPSSCHNCNGCP